MTFENFAVEFVELSNAILRVRRCGSGRPVLLLHGHPRTHMTWAKVAGILSANFTVVGSDLFGYGQSSKPVDKPDHAGSSKRAEANDCVGLMGRLGHHTFAVVGHHRGSYLAFRAALDYPDRVTRLGVLDSVPIVEALERADENFARLWWHWFFFGHLQKPEQAILANPDAWYAISADLMGREAHEDLRLALHDPATIHGMVEDYRAGLGIDRRHDEADRAAGRKVRCPTLCLWSKRDDLEELYGDVLSVWRPWAANLYGHSIDSVHYMAEEAPEALAEALADFLR